MIDGQGRGIMWELSNETLSEESMVFFMLRRSLGIIEVVMGKIYFGIWWENKRRCPLFKGDKACYRPLKDNATSITLDWECNDKNKGLNPIPILSMNLSGGAS